MQKCSLAVDIGASSGRVIAGYLQGGSMLLDEVHRFDNTLIKKNSHYCWNLEKLFCEIKEGIEKAKEQGYDPESIGIDTWAVDFVLLDENDELLTDAVAYRDSRTDGIMEEVFSFISRQELYEKTGIQFQKFNTIYQLYYLLKNFPDLMAKAKTFLMIPDYLNFLLTGKKANEYTNATTTQLVNAISKNWDEDLLTQLGINKDIFPDMLLPTTSLGILKQELAEEIGIEMEVVLPATHDTASAVFSTPIMDETIYISSGTWSLIGVESDYPITGKKALDYNFTNEGGVDYRFRFLKNIMGLWMIQEVKRNYGDMYSFKDFVYLANKATGFNSIINVDDDRFLKPANMVREIELYCEETGQPVPQSPGEIAKCVYNSLAESYQKAVEQIEEIYKQKFPVINVIGGGSKNDLLNQLIADRTGKEVLAGPTEATAIGNIAAQLISLKQIKDTQQAKDIIKKSFKLKKYSKMNGGTEIDS